MQFNLMEKSKIFRRKIKYSNIPKITDNEWFTYLSLQLLIEIDYPTLPIVEF